MTEQFDRIRPPSERLLRRGDGGELTDTAADADVAGRGALFSAGRRGHDPAGVALRCSRCGAATDLTLSTALRAALPVVLLAPWRRDPVFARCPACDRRGWLSVEVSG